MSAAGDAQVDVTEWHALRMGGPPAPGEPAPAVSAERIVVAYTAAPSSEQVIRRAAAIAERSDGELVGVHVEDGSAPNEVERATLSSHRALVGALGGRTEDVVADDVTDGIVEFAHRERATQLVLGASRRRRLTEVARGSLINETIRRAADVDVHVIATARPGHDIGRVRQPMPLSRRRRRLAWAAAVGGTAGLTALLSTARGTVGQGGQFLLYLLLVVVAALGGAAPAVTASVLSVFALNWFFTPPLHTWVIDDAENVLALVVFLTVGVLVGFLVTTLARRSADARRGRTEAEALARVAAEMIGVDDPLGPMLERMRETLGLDGLSVHGPDGGAPVAVAGDVPGDHDERRVLAGGTVRLRGSLAPSDARVLDGFLAQLTATMERRALRAEAARVEAVAAADRLRTALLRAVSHDLRTPLASIKASVTSLLQRDVQWTAGEEQDFLETIDEEVDRLDRVVGNLLDASRLEAGVIRPAVQRVAVDEVVASALSSISGLAAPVEVDISPELRTVHADQGLLERALANILSNAADVAPPGTAVRITAASAGEWVQVRIADRGRGVDPCQREDMFLPFQRLGDTAAGSGVGLGLSVARGVIEAMGGSVSVEDTPGGGLTVIIDLPAGDV